MTKSVFVYVCLFVCMAESKVAWHYWTNQIDFQSIIIGFAQEQIENERWQHFLIHLSFGLWAMSKRKKISQFVLFVETAHTDTGGKDKRNAFLIFILFYFLFVDISIRWIILSIGWPSSRERIVLTIGENSGITNTVKKTPQRKKLFEFYLQKEFP